MTLESNMTDELRATSRSFRAMVSSALWPLALMITIFHASGESNVPQPHVVPNFDKVVHLFVFGLLATLVVRVGFEPRQPLRWALIAVLVTSAYGAFDEFHQSFTPGRSVELADWIVDSLGAVLAAGTYCYWTAWRQFLERKYERRPSSTARTGGSVTLTLDEDINPS